MERRCRANNDGARMRIGFIGLGDQGGPMAQMILAGGFDLTVWARREAVRADYVRRGAKAATDPVALAAASRSEEHTSELQSLMRHSYAVFCLKKKKITRT